MRWKTVDTDNKQSQRTDHFQNLAVPYDKMMVSADYITDIRTLSDISSFFEHKSTAYE